MKNLINLSWNLALLLICMISCSDGTSSLSDIGTKQDICEDSSTHVSAEKALEVANYFMNETFGIRDGKQTRGMQKTETLYSDDNKPFAYVISYSNGGWVIVSASKSFYPVLAYSDKGDFNANLSFEENNLGLEIWIEEMVNAIEDSNNLDALSSSQIAMQWSEYESNPATVNASPVPGGSSPEAIACRARLKELNETLYKEGWSFTTLTSTTNITVPDYVYTVADSQGSPHEYTIVGVRDVSTRTEVQPLISTEWHQNYPYNGLCPDNCRAGCVPIAMAQIMKFHRCPDKFDWNNMLDDDATYATKFLIADIGKTIEADYGEDETSASIDDAIKGFKSYGYSVMKKDHNNTDVCRTLSQSKNPVYMRGRRNLAKGHAWVCDGIIQVFGEYEYYVEYIRWDNSYENLGYTLLENPGRVGGTSYTRMHMNWGWGSKAIGWYIGAQAADSLNYQYDRKNLYVTPL